MDVLFVDSDAIPFSFLVFLLTGPSAAGLLEVHSRPCLPGNHLQNSKDYCLFLPMVVLSQKGTCQLLARALLYEVTLWIYRGQGAA